MISGTPIPAGVLTFALEYRDFNHERGWTIHSYGLRCGKREEILRFDCFEHNPHFHLGWSYLDRFFIPIPSHIDPLEWVIEELRTHLPEMLRESDAAELVPLLDDDLIQEAIDELRAQANARAAA